ncbi:zinc finger MYM-type protein 1-like [Mya arenaria]|uniref:zinc finger MYM-type protein 1-like n=1 Tax=Mya arenaria TaxID=6604 RepID=UPI0022E0ED1F|nr:zinc finger MYM-type protein 1-like [Mya arenaria]
MAGKYNGVQALIRERLPLAHYTHCKSQCQNLSLVHSSKLPCVRTMMSTVQDIAFAFDYSAKRLTTFADELSEAVVTKQAMEGRQKLKTLCETRWMSRADALRTFKNAYRVVVHALETLQENGDVKASDHLNAILQFQFIVTLVATEHILSNLVGLTAVLQAVDMDLLEAIEQTKVVMQIYQAERDDPLVWDALYQEAVTLADEFQIDPAVPRQAARQRNRANYDLQDPSRYWKVSVFYVFVDHLLQEMDTRILKNEERFQAQWLIPTKFEGLLPANVDRIYEAYEPDLPKTRQEFSEEVRRWNLRWQLNDAKPSTLLATLNKTSEAAYPCIYIILQILLTMPATSASCERSFSSMRRIKTYLRSTMTGERLSSLGVLHIHRDVEIDIIKIINAFASTLRLSVGDRTTDPPIKRWRSIQRPSDQVLAMESQTFRSSVGDRTKDLRIKRRRSKHRPSNHVLEGL